MKYKDYKSKRTVLHDLNAERGYAKTQNMRSEAAVTKLREKPYQLRCAEKRKEWSI